MELTGIVRDIIYQNEVNSYTIAVLETQEQDITIVGYLPFLNVGDTLKVVGNYTNHPTYGEQFKVDTFEKLMPQTLDALEKYLANGTIKGIGPATARKIITMFQEETLQVLQKEPERLAKIKGITQEKAYEIVEEFNQNWDLWQIVGFLERYGIGAANAQNVYKKLGNAAIEEIEANPYILIDVANNVDFKKIDKMALDLGISYDNDKRVTSGIKYALLQISYNGHTCTLKENLIQYLKQLLKVEEDRIDTCLMKLKVTDEIVIETRENEEEWVYLTSFYEAECNIASRLLTLQASQNSKMIKGLKKEIKTFEKLTNITLSEKQKEAVEAINENNVVIITGGPGTGKTTIIKTILHLYQKEGKKVVLCAPTGRAAKRITETTGEEAKTLHRLLEIGKIDDQNHVVNKDYEIAPIDADVIVIDEMSMVDLFLMNYLMKGIFQGTKLILVGDKDQLPSVGPGSILKDCIDSEKICTIQLDKIFRQAAKSKIILNAHQVNQGKSFVKRGEEELVDDFFYLAEKTQEEIVSQVVSLCKGRLQVYGDYDFFHQIQVLSPTKKGKLGTKELNRILQQELNPEKEGTLQKKMGETVFRVGDRVMQIKNNYDIYWEKKNKERYENGSGVFNGELGTIENILEAEQQIKVRYDDEKEVWYSYNELDQLEHAYCITIHKAQGSEFDVVIMVVPATAPMLLTRNLLYTGITRAKKLLILLSEPKVIDFMIQNVDSKKRNTGLCEKLRSI